MSLTGDCVNRQDVLELVISLSLKCAGDVHHTWRGRRGNVRASQFQPPHFLPVPISSMQQPQDRFDQVARL